MNSAQPISTGSPVEATAPGMLKVIKRDGSVVRFDDDKILWAIKKAYLATEGEAAGSSSRVTEFADALTQRVVSTFKRRAPSGGTVHIEEIQDQVELELMRAGEHKVARDYVLYREQQAAKRASISTETRQAASGIKVATDGGMQDLNIDSIFAIVERATGKHERVSSEIVVNEALKGLYDGVTYEEVKTALIIAARTLIEKEPDYSYVAAGLLAENLREEALGFLGVDWDGGDGAPADVYPIAFEKYIAAGVELELLSPALKQFDLQQLGQAIQAERDEEFTYLGLQTLYDRYFIHSDDVRFELPQIFFMRVAMGLAINEDDINQRAIEFYNLISSFDYMTSTPTLFNAGTLRPQLSSCYLTTVPDDLHGIYGAIRDNAMLSKFAGGLGNDWTNVRSLGSRIKGTNGKSQGVVPFLKVVNDTAVAVNQGGKRKGAVCAYLETWHLDIEEFLDLRKNTGDDRRRTHDMNTANWIPDLFMKRVFDGGDWTLFSPSDAPDLHDLYGKAFQERYEHYEALAQAGELKLSKTVKAEDLWRKMLGMLFETGHPWVTFKDPCNIRSPQQHVGVVHSSNLCTEITLNTSDDEIAVCNLGSVNLPRHTTESGIDHEKLRRTVRTAVRMLDNVIDINYYSVDQARNSNLKHRPVGLGLMGFQDALYVQGIGYASDAAVEFADRSMEAISYYAIEASSELAEERGAYESYPGSLWAQGVLPIDSLGLLAEERGADYLKVDLSTTMDWDVVRKKIANSGMRNSNVMAIAPTATIANITGVSQSIEPTYQNLYVKSNLSGEFTVVNPHMARDLQNAGLWDEVMVNDLKYYDGSVQAIERIPEHLREQYKTAFEVDAKWIVEAASRRQKWIDQAQSLNLYINNANGKKLDFVYKMAWLTGLKTTYYLRSLAATSTEKSTIDTGALNAVSNKTEAAPAPVPQACSLDDPDCEACQ
ncbi:ribonucleotide-diphosphate reductase subunit alpha [Halioglobus sp. HI00S01]|uniref:ribonucleoside-diphosphate reductase subunit alpha n=1 Tax=Halioglobus sp. HI00S01 TaxID=1822214 RepID=UPI0007C2BF67|nr:ribonucleoside-diphosphate reductase subunit alpha [Halioglobus sp. HI00S01]KZX57728.1 ribonucleotide-diphosphate reductase subunit alpha [Halioglobus sp. HI00S01]